jgi:prophage maintenance system killer protein
MKTKESYNILKVINDYSSSMDMLDKYDHNILDKIKGTKERERIKYEDCLDIIAKMSYYKTSDIFGVDREKSLESVINNVYQGFGDSDVYLTVEEKSANLLYFIIKDHVFIDGNKRIGAILFLYFLDFNNLLYVNDTKLIEPETLTALTLLVAQSNPKEKDVIIDLVMNLINRINK